MKTSKILTLLVFFILTIVIYQCFADLKVRVIVSKANIRLKPNTQSAIVKTASMGAIMEVIKKEGNWYYINLPPSESGSEVTGYIHQSIVEVVQEEKEKSPEVTPQVTEPKKGISGEKEFSKGSKYVAIQFGLNSYAIPFGVSLEIAINENVGVGGSVMLQFWGEDYSYVGLGYKYSSTLITPAVEVAYHFTKLKVNKLDLSAGASIGFSIYSYRWESEWPGIEDIDVGTSGLYLSPFLNGAYYFSPKNAVKLRIYFSAVGGWTGIGGLLGIIMRLK